MNNRSPRKPSEQSSAQDTSRAKKQISLSYPSTNRAVLWCSVSLIAIISMHESAFAQDATPIPDVNINAPAAQANNGSAAAGYREENITGGIGSFWGDLPTQDAPYSVFILPHELIENQQTINLQDALKYNPDIQFAGSRASLNASGGQVYTVIRGISSSSPTNFSTDNLYSPTGYYTPTEDKESVSVLTGVSGFLYGVQNLSGHIDSELKRPTATPLLDFTAGTNTSHNFYGHLDLGGPLQFQGIDPGIFGYRLNLMEQAGGTTIHNQYINRNLASLALDAHLPDNLLVQLNVSHSQYRLWGPSPEYEVNQSLLNAPNPDQLYANPAGKYVVRDDIGGVKITWKPNDIFTLRSQYAYTVHAFDENGGPYVYYTGNTDPSTVTPQFEMYGGGTTSYSHSGYAYLDTDFDIFGSHHKITTGFNGYWTEANQAGTFTNYQGASSPTCSLYALAACNLTPAFSSGTSTAYGHGYVTGVTYNKNYMIGDEAKFWGDRIIVLAGANYADTGAMTFLSNGTLNGKRTDASAITPTASITYKILPWLSSYVSFQQGLTAGSYVPLTGTIGGVTVAYTNANALIPPVETTSWEGGIKATIGNNMLASMAIFDLYQPTSYSITNNTTPQTLTYVIGTREHVQGIEFKLAGKVYDDLTLYGGLTLLNPRLAGTPSSPWLQGALVPNVSEVTATLYSEYTIPFFSEAPWLHNLTLTAGIRYMGPQEIATPGSYTVSYGLARIQGYALGDLGFRYVYDLNGHPTTFRFTASNITNQAYWVGGGQDVGAGRQFAATTEFKW